MKYALTLQGEALPAALAGPRNARRLLLANTSHAVALDASTDASATLTIDGVTHLLHIAGDDSAWFVHIAGETYEIAVLDPLQLYARRAIGPAGLTARAPMPGSVVALPLGIGASVQLGDTLVIMESMKLEVSIRAECAGIVAEIHCSLGQTCDRDAVLVTLAEPA